jgi:hypothetical protein
VIDVAMQANIDDISVKTDGIKIMNLLLSKGATVALKDVMKIGKMLEFNVPLDIAEKIQIDLKASKKKEKATTYTIEEDVGDLANQQLVGLTKVVKAMIKFTHDAKVQEAGLETFMILARHGNNVRDIVPTEGIETLVNAMNMYPKVYRIQWRGCACITDLAVRDAGVCSELGKRGAVQAVMNAYDRFDSSKDVRQQALWAMAGLIKQEHCRQRLEEAGLVTVLYKLVALPLKHAGMDAIDVVVPLIFKQKYSLQVLESHASAKSVKKVAVKVEKRGGGGSASAKKKKKNAAFGTADDYFKEGEKGLLD